MLSQAGRDVCNYKLEHHTKTDLYNILVFPTQTFSLNLVVIDLQILYYAQIEN